MEKYRKRSPAGATESAFSTLQRCSNNSADFLLSMSPFPAVFIKHLPGAERSAEWLVLAVNERDETIGQACNPDNYTFLSYQALKVRKGLGVERGEDSVLPAFTKAWTPNNIRCGAACP